MEGLHRGRHTHTHTVTHVPENSSDSSDTAESDRNIGWDRNTTELRVQGDPTNPGKTSAYDLMSCRSSLCYGCRQVQIFTGVTILIRHQKVVVVLLLLLLLMCEQAPPAGRRVLPALTVQNLTKHKAGNRKRISQTHWDCLGDEDDDNLRMDN